jgi:aerobic C4-dicarboxylate transport protein
MSATLESGSTGSEPPVTPPRDRTHYLYMSVIFAVIAGVLVGGLTPDGFGRELKPLGDGFIALIRMMISPIIFCTIVLGVGSIRQAAKVGKVGGLALGYFMTMSTAALAIGLLVGNILQPGSGLDLSGLEGSGAKAAGESHGTTVEFILGIIPTTLVSPCWSVSPSRRWVRRVNRSCAGSATCRSWCSGSS